uniref:Succinate:cytochrome c oxidoreductase subunit 4 n=1 Tax=Chlorokybus atmophyticus TaxID=3144 RepID=A6YE86_CHLAT|nr:succinate:cytochrome c oxidoreductase subunit 4 [Chlorokybus atmophyticus]ABO15126.1 succinate:cytochrome c oxidoreductase subunit 4 [Chlorokybus atmophyticus]
MKQDFSNFKIKLQSYLFKPLFLSGNQSGKASTHWHIQRLTAILLFPTILSLNPSLILLLIAVLPLHIQAGISEILDDYVHNEVTRMVSILLARLFILKIIKYTFILFLV